MARSKQDSTSKTNVGPRWKTALTNIERNQILVRGYPIDELMGRVHFGEAVYLLFTGELPTPSIGRLVDAMLVSLIDHGTTPPSTLAARNAATTGASMRGCLATGLLCFGKYHGGGILSCRQLLDEGFGLVRKGKSLTEAATTLVDRIVEAGDLPPAGFGHRYHATDPRAIRLLQMAHELEMDDVHTQLIRAIEHALSRHPALADRTLPINVDGAVAAICGDIGLAPEIADALVVVSRIAGLAAHAMEEQRREVPMRVIDPDAHVYDGPSERRVPGRRK